jgi:hypothetical protein
MQDAANGRRIVSIKKRFAGLPYITDDEATDL